MSDAQKTLGYLSRQKLARLSEKLKERAVKAAPQKIGRRPDRSAPCPLSFAQLRLWFLDQLAPNSSLYNLPAALRLEGRLDLEVLERVINEIVKRHEILRTRFDVVDGEPLQVIEDWKIWRLEVTDLTGLPPEERETEAGWVAISEAGTGFDLSRGPLLRCKVLKLEEWRHVVFFTMHHIVSDAWSMRILIREVGTLYRAYSMGDAGEFSPLDELPIQYADFTVWQRAWLQGEALEREIEYWRKQLQGMEVLELPTDHPRPAAPSYRGGSQSFVIERELAEKLKALAQREGVTMFMALLGSFDVLMSRYSGQEDVALGTDIANRNRAEVEALIGFFVNQLVLRVEVRARESFSALLKRVREACLGAYAHQDLPFEKLVEELEPERDLGRSPLFQVKLIWQNAPREELILGETRGISSDELLSASELQTAKFDLTVAITDTGDDCPDLVGAVSYSRDLFEEETIGRLISHYTNLLREVAHGDLIERSISELSLLGGAEREQILVEWNDTGRPYPQDRCIHELFESQVESTPEAIALIYEDRRLSYAELNARANQLARRLRRFGVLPETLVGVCAGRSPEMVVGLLGILKAGGAYVPIDPAYPAERIALMLDDAEVKALLTEQRYLDILPGTNAQVVTMDEDWRLIGIESKENLPKIATAENLAYVIYTSGSTGRPKGVSVPNQQVVNFFTAMDADLDSVPASVWLAVTSISFDISVLELLWTLTRGFQVVIRRERRSARPPGEPDGASTESARALRPGESSANDEDFSIAAQIIKHRASHLQCTPSMAKILSVEMGSVNSLSSLCKIMIGGEAFPIGLAEALKPLAAAQIHNMYGPTETTVWSATYLLRGEERSIPIGRPIANTQLYILDREMHIVPIGVPGELYIGGKGVVRGYLNLSELTAERFIPDQFGSEPGARLYRTGDTARYLPDGNVEFLGRVDHQVKIRGFRIELGEIEAALLRRQSISECVVLARGDEEKRLIAYLVSRDGQRVDLSELREYLKQSLPEYMAPSLYVWLEKMPLTSNGKIDRMALPEAKEAGIARKREYVAPSGPVEETLADIWSELLGVEKVGVHDNFFELGGHSLLLTQVVLRVRLAFSSDMPLRALFDAPTIKQLSVAIVAEQLSEADSTEAAELLQELQRLSPEEIQSMLESEMDEDYVKDEPESTL